jgi:hypothetical protein
MLEQGAIRTARWPAEAQAFSVFHLFLTLNTSMISLHPGSENTLAFLHRIVRDESGTAGKPVTPAAGILIPLPCTTAVHQSYLLPSFAYEPYEGPIEFKDTVSVLQVPIQESYLGCFFTGGAKSLSNRTVNYAWRVSAGLDSVSRHKPARYGEGGYEAAVKAESWECIGQGGRCVGRKAGLAVTGGTTGAPRL